MGITILTISYSHAVKAKVVKVNAVMLIAMIVL